MKYLYLCPLDPNLILALTESLNMIFTKDGVVKHYSGSNKGLNLDILNFKWAQNTTKFAIWSIDKVKIVNMASFYHTCGTQSLAKASMNLWTVFGGIFFHVFSITHQILSKNTSRPIVRRKMVENHFSQNLPSQLLHFIKTKLTSPLLSGIVKQPFRICLLYKNLLLVPDGLINWQFWFDARMMFTP